MAAAKKYAYCYYYAVDRSPKSATISIHDANQSSQPNDESYNYGGNILYNRLSSDYAVQSVMAEYEHPYAGKVNDPVYNRAVGMRWYFIHVTREYQQSNLHKSGDPFEVDYDTLNGYTRTIVTPKTAGQKITCYTSTTVTAGASARITNKTNGGYGTFQYTAKYATATTTAGFFDNGIALSTIRSN